MRDLARKAKLLDGYLENQLFSPAVVRGKQIIWTRGAALCGRPYLARAAEEHSGPHMPWFWEGTLQGGGVLNDMMCHSVEEARFMLTPPGAKRNVLTPIKITAHASCLKWQDPKYAKILADNSAQRFGPVHTQALVQACQAQSGKEGMREVIRQRALELMEDILRLTQRKKDYLTMGYKTLRKVSIAKTLRQVPGFGRSNTLAVLTGVGLNVDRWPDGDHLASFLGLTTSKHISGVTLHVSTHITKQGDPNPRYALVNAADHLRREVPFYKATYTRVKAKKGKDGGHYTALCAIARHFAANVLYDMIKTGRPFFVQTEDYRRHRQQQRDAALVARQLPAAG